MPNTKMINLIRSPRISSTTENTNISRGKWAAPHLWGNGEPISTTGNKLAVELRKWKPWGPLQRF